jgi:hypothetical protein
MLRKALQQSCLVRQTTCFAVSWYGLLAIDPSDRLLQKPPTLKLIAAAFALRVFTLNQLVERHGIPHASELHISQASLFLLMVRYSKLGIRVQRIAQS